MRKTLITTLALITSLSTFAASNNYDSKKTNDDGTATIVGPKFKVATGANSRLSSRSNNDGVCRLYGYDFMVGSTSISIGDDRNKTTIIKQNGKFGGTYSYNNSTNNSYIASIVCSRNHQTLSVSTRIRPILNDDGSYTILNPTVGYYDQGNVRRVSSRSDANGVCQYFGLAKAVNGGKLTAGDDRNRTVIIGNNGTINSFYKYNNSTNNGYITSIVCEGNIDNGDVVRDDLDETVEITRRELLRMENQIEKLTEENRNLKGELRDANSANAQLRAALEAKIQELENEIRLNGAAKKQLKKLKRQLRNLADEPLN